VRFILSALIIFILFFFIKGCLPLKIGVFLVCNSELISSQSLPGVASHKSFAKVTAVIIITHYYFISNEATTIKLNLKTLLKGQSNPISFLYIIIYASSISGLI
jgi:hypothetical protein